MDIDSDLIGSIGRAVAVTRHAQHEAQLHTRRGGTRRTAPGTGRQAQLSLDDRVAITLLHLRFATRQRAIGALFDVTQQTVHNVVKQTRPLLTLAGHDVPATGIVLADADAVIQYHSSPTVFMQYTT
ncbi:transposase family protein [Nocardia sp. NPDC046763]|uniref:transposase family protein n=1 Tax=Nocardia sp. NPDC046763 TaxID=3155256 RepID=UPI00340CD0EF